MEKNENNDGALLKEYLLEQNIDFADFAKTIGRSKQSLYHLFKKDDFNAPILAIICQFLPLTPTFFRKSPKTFDKFKDLINDSYQTISYEFERKHENLSYRSFLQKYFERINKNISRARKSIIVLDYLDDTRETHHKPKLNKQDISVFKAYYKQYLENIAATAIKATEANKDFEYIRVFQLPLKYSSGLNYLDNGIHDVMELVQEETINHLEEMYRAGYKNFKVYWLKQPLRPYSLAIIDDHTLLTEYIKFNSKGRQAPDILQIHSIEDIRNGENARILIESYSQQINKVLKDSNEISREFARLSLEQICSECINHQKMLLRKISITHGQSRRAGGRNDKLLETIVDLNRDLKKVEKSLNYNTNKLLAFGNQEIR